MALQNVYWYKGDKRTLSNITKSHLTRGSGETLCGLWFGEDPVFDVPAFVEEEVCRNCYRSAGLDVEEACRKAREGGITAKVAGLDDEE